MSVLTNPIPHSIALDDLKKLCADFGVPKNKEADLIKQISEIVSGVSNLMRKKSSDPEPQDDRAQIAQTARSLRKAAAGIRKLSEDGHRMTSYNLCDPLAQMVSIRWLGSRVEGVPTSPSVRYFDSREFNQRNPDLEAWSAPIRYDVAERHGSELLVAVLDGFAAALEAGPMPIARPGRRKNWERDLLIKNLAVAWKRAGREPVGTQSGDFIAFVEQACELIGWKIDGVAAAVPKALHSLRNSRPDLL